MRHLFTKPAVYPRDWPALDSENNQPNFKPGQNHKLLFTPLTATIIYNPDEFTAAQKAYLLSLFNPEQPNAFFVSVKQPLGQDLLRQVQLPKGSYLIFASQTELTIQPLFLPNLQTAELDFLSIEDIACKITAKDDLIQVAD